MKYPSVLVVGSQNVKEQDRFLERSEIRPVQILNRSEFQPISFFDDKGKFGISSLAWNQSNPLIFYYSTGDDLIRLNLKNKCSEEVKIEGLGGVHEIDFIDGLIYIANTRFDEIIVFDVNKNSVLNRIKLTELTYTEAESRKEAADGQVVDKYHCNQIFKGFDKKIYFLAHHVTGRQFLQKIAGALLKSQGNGGVFNLDDSIAHNLSLKAPHSVTKVRNQEYWVFNSAYSTIQIHDKNWKKIEEFEMSGFGRGACLNEDQTLLFAGVSPPRKRYMEVFKPKQNVFDAKVEVFSTQKRKSIQVFKVSNLEQVNNLYLLTEEQVSYLAKL